MEIRLDVTAAVTTGFLYTLPWAHLMPPASNSGPVTCPATLALLRAPL